MRRTGSFRLGGLLAFCLFSLFSFNGSAQVGIGTTNPNGNALLDVDASTTVGGLLLPRFTLSATNNFAPLTAHVAGMTVYNMATAGTAPNNVTPGYYFNDGAKWVRIAADVPSDDWYRTGNAGTVAGTNFLGTTDDVSLELFSNNTSRMRVENDGQISIGFGATAVNIDQQFNVGSTYNDGTAIGGYSGGAGIGVYGQNIATGYGVFGLNNSIGYGVYGTNSSSGQGIRGYNSGTGWGVGGRAISATGVGVVAYNTDAAGPGLIASGANAPLAYLPSTGGTFNGTFGGAGFSTSASGTGIVGVGNNGNTTYTLTNGSGVSGTGAVTGIYGISTATSGTRQGGYFTMNKSGMVSPPANDDPYAILAGYNGTNYFGGYFDGNQDNTNNGNGSNQGEDYAYVGITSGNTTYKILGTGTNSTMVNDSSGNKRVLFSPEAPEVLFEDYGTGQLVNGVATVTLDPLLSSIIHVSENHPLKVFIQLEGECNGVFVMAKSKQGFTVKELANGRSNVSFSWHIVANREDTKLADGTVFSKHVDVRFPIGPKKIRQQDIHSNKIETSKVDSDEDKEVSKDLDRLESN